MTADARVNGQVSYQVEICHPGTIGWNGIHPPAWETTGSENTAQAYAAQVRQDHPDSMVRIVKTATYVTTEVIMSE